MDGRLIVTRALGPYFDKNVLLRSLTNTIIWVDPNLYTGLEHTYSGARLLNQKNREEHEDAHLFCQLLVTEIS